MDTSTIAQLAAAAAGVGLGAYMMVEPFRILTRQIHLGFADLPQAFDGYNILHLSDLHITQMGSLERRVMSIIGSRQVDACFITGDVTSEPRASDLFRRVCSVIPHRDPIYLVLGNSEHKPWLDTEMLVDALSFEGLQVLVNSSATIERGGQAIRIAGVDDPYSRLDDLDAAFAGVDPGEFIVFLTHSACNAPDAIARGADLILSGHTHGGQVRIPGVGMLFTHMRRNHALNDGLYLPDDLRRRANVDTRSSVLFVSRGVGTSRLHIRLLCRPEIVYITLHRSDEALPHFAAGT